MKSSPLHSISPISAIPRIRLSKSVAVLFAAALAMGLGAQSALAQGGYYPQVAPLGGAPFTPNGVPVITNLELNYIESKMPGNATLIIPAILPKTVATLAEYKIAVQAAAKDAAVGAAGSVTVASLAAEVAKYRQGPPSQVGDGLSAVAAGIISSASGTKSADLQAMAFNAAKVDPAGATAGGILAQAFATVAADNTLVASLGAVVNNALLGATAGNPPPSALQAAGVKTLVANAASAIANAPTGNPATATNALKGGLISGLAATVVPGLVGSAANIDQAAASLLALAVQPYVSPASMTATLKAAVPASDANYGAIAQGGLRTNPAASAAIRAALGTAYTNDLVDAFNAFAAPGNAGALALSYDPVAVAAAGATKYGSSTPQIVKDVLNSSGASGSQAQDIIGRGVAAAIGTAAQNVASAAVGAGGATLSDVTTGATKSAPIDSAGAIAKAVIVAGGLTNANATSVGGAAIAAAAAVSPVANKTNAYTDIAYNLSDAVKGAGVGVGNAAVTAEVQAILVANGGVAATSPSYTATVAAAAGAPANRAAILAAGNAAVAGDDDAASTAGVNLLAALTNVPLSNYQATLSAVAAPGNDARNLAVLEAASLGNPGDAAASLAALIANTTTSQTALTAAAISANRAQQTGLTIAADVAAYAKANPTGNIQASVGRQILDNPTYAKQITAAATVVLPQFSHFIAHTVAFNQPKTASDSVAGIFLHSQITVPGKMAFGDRPAAAAAITGALTTGILESILPAADRKSALQGVVVEAVKALVNPLYNDAQGGPAAFKQSDGGVGTFTLVKSKGVAGGITGFTAQMVNPGVNAIDSDTLNALFQASYNAGILTGTTYTLDIAQAAGQAFGWVTGVATSAAGAVVADQIANAVRNGYPVLSLASIRNAVDFGINQAAGGEIVGNVARTPGAGAGGLRDVIFNPSAPYYDHHSASGRPVSNIFSL